MPTEMVPPTLELARGRLVAFAVLAIAASVVFGVALHNAIEHPRFSHAKRPLRAEITLRNLHQLADEGFPRWRVAHPLDRCPRTIEDLAAYTDADIRGPYAGEATYIFTCDVARMPPRVHGIWIRDLGADELLGTADDYTSDMELDPMIEPTYQRTQLWRPVRRRMNVAITTGFVTCFVAVIAGLVQPSPTTFFGTGPDDVARMTVMKLANESFPEWREHHTGCPHRLADLLPSAVLDPWGHAMHYTCDRRLAGADELMVISAGPDGRFGTLDDVSSR